MILTFQNRALLEFSALESVRITPMKFNLKLKNYVIGKRQYMPDAAQGTVKQRMRGMHAVGMVVIIGQQVAVKSKR
eukprot:14267-Heterococcus_DN1.PRE.1